MTNQQQIQKLIHKIDNYSGCEIIKTESVQTLWSGYGEIVRYFLKNTPSDSIVVKHVQLAVGGSNHPRGWNSDIGHQRKLKSYQVESYFYSHYAADSYCHFPDCLLFENLGDDVVIIMEDLNQSGFSIRKSSVTIDEMKACLRWLAYFHARFLGCNTEELWKTGSYWHLATRPEELAAMPDCELKTHAPAIDRILENARYKTFIHGDAKLANFCFPNKRYLESHKYKVAAVDFQYIGGGVGVKDVAYFIGSCLYEDQIMNLVDQLLDFYFEELKSALVVYQSDVNSLELENEWRYLFPFAWTDFHRFLLGWSPGHWKINGYSEQTARMVIQEILQNDK